MKSLADFKRLAKEGALFERTFLDGTNIPPKIRKVAHVQSNALTFVEPHQTDRSHMAWFYFPKTKYLRFQNGVMTILTDDGTPRMMLKHLPKGDAA